MTNSIRTINSPLGKEGGPTQKEAVMSFSLRTVPVLMAGTADRVNLVVIRSTSVAIMLRSLSASL